MLWRVGASEYLPKQQIHLFSKFFTPDLEVVQSSGKISLSNLQRVSILVHADFMISSFWVISPSSPFHGPRSKKKPHQANLMFC